MTTVVITDSGCSNQPPIRIFKKTLFISHEYTLTYLKKSTVLKKTCDNTTVPATQKTIKTLCLWQQAASVLMEHDIFYSNRFLDP